MVNLQEPFFVFSPKCHCCPWGVPSEKSGTDCWFSWSPINNWATPRLLEVAPRHFFFFFAGTSASCFWKSGVSQWLGLPNDFIPHSCWYFKKKQVLRGLNLHVFRVPPPKKKKHGGLIPKTLPPLPLQLASVLASWGKLGRPEMVPLRLPFSQFGHKPWWCWFHSYWNL